MALPHRSLLFMPADNARAHAKAVTLPADALIFDLEDAVAATDKTAARAQVLASAATQDYGDKALYLRINHPDHAEARDDVATLARLPCFAGLIIPKVESAESIARISGWMDEAGCAAEQHIAIMLETPRGILNAQRIVENQPRLHALIAGTNDLAAEMHLPPQRQREGLQPALAHIVLVARAYGLQAYDGVYNRLRDTEGLQREALQGRALGFDGKTLIHPAQVDITNAAFSPSPEEIAAAEAVIAQWQSQQKGVTAAEGAMIEELHMRNARRILALADANRSQH